MKLKVTKQLYQNGTMQLRTYVQLQVALYRLKNIAFVVGWKVNSSKLVRQDRMFCYYGE